MKHTKTIINVLKVAGIASLALTLSAITINHVTGSTKAIFSGINFLLPLAGSCLSLSQCTGLLAVLWCIKQLIKGMPVTLGFPTIASMLSWSARTCSWADLLVNVALPLGCMGVFIAATASTLAWTYSLYWLIPVALWAVHNINRKSTIFTKALQSTFIAHAVGSVMWLNMVPMVPTQWVALIPVVAAERLIMAASMTIVYYVLGYARHILFTAASKKSAQQQI
jgi:hypothetical protein